MPLKVTDIIQKQVITIQEARNIGICSKVVFKEKFKKALGIIIEGISKIYKTEYFVKFSDIYNIGEHAITIKSNNVVEMENPYFETIKTQCYPFFANVFQVCGKNVGILSDICINKSNGIVESVSTIGNEEFLPSQISSISNELIIIKQPVPSKIETCSIASACCEPSKLSEQNEQNNQAYTKEIDMRFFQSLESNESSFFLLGKTLLKNVCKNNLIIARKGDIVCMETIARCKEENCYRILIRSCYP